MWVGGVFQSLLYIDITANFIKPSLYAVPCTLITVVKFWISFTWSTAVITEHMKRCLWSECYSLLSEILCRATGQPMKVTLYQHLAQSNAQPASNWYSSKSPANYWSGALVMTAENVRGTAEQDDKYFSPALYSMMCFKCNIISDSYFCVLLYKWMNILYILKHWSCHCNGCLKQSF